MPELPEVEVIRRGLKKALVGQRIARVEVFCEKSFIGPKEVLVGRKILDVRRVGKALMIDCSEGISVMIHLRMTGQMIYRSGDGLGVASVRDFEDIKTSDAAARDFAGALDDKQNFADVLADKRNFADVLAEERNFAGGHPSESFFEELPNKQTRVEFVLAGEDESGGEGGSGGSGVSGGDGGSGDGSDGDDGGSGDGSDKSGACESDSGSDKSGACENGGGKLFFNDQRKFGFCKILETAKISEEAFIRTLGKEPWEMGEAEFFEKLQRHKGAPIKAVILDQKVIAGVGNIYADESLWAAKIHPAMVAGKVSFSEAKELLGAIREVMERSIESGGSTMQTYVKADGTRGDYLRLFAKVFRREGEPCERCGGEIVKTRVAGRGTHFCPKCQKI